MPVQSVQSGSRFKVNRTATLKNSNLHRRFVPGDCRKTCFTIDLTGLPFWFSSTGANGAHVFGIPSVCSASRWSDFLQSNSIEFHLKKNCFSNLYLYAWLPKTRWMNLSLSPRFTKLHWVSFGSSTFHWVWFHSGQIFPSVFISFHQFLTSFTWKAGVILEHFYSSESRESPSIGFMESAERP